MRATLLNEKAEVWRTNEPATRNVTFELDNDRAEMVYLAGAFNDWHPAATPMVNVGNGRWIKTLCLKPGVYEYLFVVDGQWITDPRATAIAANPFGGFNSVVTVEPDAEQLAA